MISVVLLAYEEADALPETLRKAGSVADEIIVVDSYSEDRTAEVATEHGATVYQRDWQGYADAWRFGFEKATGDWILQLGADEHVTQALARRLREIDSREETAPGYKIRRVNYVFGRRLDHWTDDAPIFFRPEAGTMTDRAVHERVELDGTWGDIDAPLDHYTYEDVSEYLQKFDRYTALEVEEFDGEPSLRRLFVTPPRQTGSLLFREGLILDGIDGVFIAVMSGLYQFVAAYRGRLAANSDVEPPSEVR